MVHRVKDDLKSGDIVVTGDRWPLFLYANCEYDPEDPWSGLLQNSILISVSHYLFVTVIKHLTLDGSRLSSMYSLPLVPSTKSLKRLVLVTLVSTTWLVPPVLPLRISPRRCIAESYILWGVHFLIPNNNRFDLLLARHLCSPVQTPSRTLSGSTTVCWRSWTTRRRKLKWTLFWIGGISGSRSRVVVVVANNANVLAKCSQALLRCYAQRRRTGHQPKSVRSELHLVKESLPSK